MNPEIQSQTLSAAHDAAKHQSWALQDGRKWRCARVDAYVDNADCLQRHAAAQSAGGYCPCLECSIVQRFLPKNGGNMPRTAMLKESVKKIAKKTAAAPPPAKKAAQKSEPTPPPEKKTAADPFAGWESYIPKRQLCSLNPYVILTKNEFIFNMSVCRKFNLDAFLSVDAFFKSGRIGLRFCEDQSATLRLSALYKKSSGSSFRIAATGMITTFGLGDKIGKRFPLTELSPGFLEINLEKEIA